MLPGRATSRIRTRIPCSSNGHRCLPQTHSRPACPKVLLARAVADRDVELRWKSLTDNVAVAGYYLWRNGKKMVAVTDPRDLRYRWLRLKLPVEQYTFAVSAFDAAGNESPLSAAAKAAR